MSNLRDVSLSTVRTPRRYDVEKQQEILDSISFAEVKVLYRRVFELGMEGKTDAWRYVLDHYMPSQKKDNPIHIDIEKIETIEDLDNASNKVIKMMGRGDITPMEASTIMNVFTERRRVIETRDLVMELEEIKKLK